MQKSQKPEVLSPETQTNGDALNAETTTPPSGSGTTEDAALPRFTPPTAAGELGRLGKYRIQKELGRGGMGAVYLAFDERLQRKVALKVMLPKAAANTTAKDRFLREARAAAQINSDFVVGIYEADEIDGIPYIALQFLQGYPLDEYLRKKGRPTIPQCIRIARETALGLAAAHKLGLVHRDIKPGNIWLEAPNGRVKVLDFGLAKPVQGNEKAELTASGAVVGTPAYMAPEQGMGQPLDGRADLFSLGCVLYRLVTGKLPFDQPTLMAILASILIEEPTPVRELNPEVPEALADLIRRLMAKKPENRPASAKVVADELARIAAPSKPAAPPGSASGTQIPVAYVPVEITMPPNPFADIAIAESDEATDTSAEQAKPPKKPRRFPALLVGGVFVGLLAIILGGFIVIKITNKGGTVTELKVPSDSKIEINGQTIKPQLPVKPPGTSPELDRKAAESALSLGGTIRIDGQDVNDLAKLPKGAIRLTGLFLAKNTKVSDSDLALFKDCKHLRELGLSDTRVSDVGLAHFKDCKTLTWLSLDSTLMSDTGLAYFKDCRNLQELDLYATKVSDAGLAHFKEWKNLTHLQLQNTNVTDAGMIHLKGCKNLLRLGLSGTQVSDAGLAHFQDCKNLTWLSLDGTQVSNAGLAHFQDCKNLARLDLVNTRVTDGGLAYFKDSKTLRELKLSGTQVTDGGLAHIKDCTNLVSLGVTKTKVTAKFIDELKQALPQCRIEWDGGTIEPTIVADPDRKAAEYALSLGGMVRVDGQTTDIKDAANLPNRAFRLNNLFLNDTRVSDDDLVQFKDCNNLTRLRLGSTQVTDAGMVHFKDCKNLIELHLPNTKIGDAGLAHFKNCKDLTLIQLTGTGVTDEGIAHFKDCKNLRALKIDRTKVTDAGLAHFKGCKNLTMLYLSHNRVTDVGMAHFMECTSLAAVQLRSTQLTDAGMTNFKEFKILQTLDLSKTPVSDAGLAMLKGCSKLIQLDLRETKVTAKFIDELKQALPQCKIEWDGGTIEPTIIADPDRKAAEYALSLGGKVRVDGLATDIQDPANLPKTAFRLTHLNLSDTKVDDAGLANFKDCKNLMQLYLFRTQVSDLGLATFKDCKNLTYLHLYTTKVSDVGLANFKDCNNLTHLNLNSTQVSDAGLAYFKDCKNLKELNLGNTKVTDAGLTHFQDCKGLTKLALSATQVSDAGLAFLKGCKNLTELKVKSSKVTAKFIDELKVALPQCKIE